MPYAADFVRLCQIQSGEQYVYGAEVNLDDEDPHGPWDCSELVQWATYRLGVPMPDGSANQLAHCQGRGLLIPVDDGVHSAGALLFIQNNTYRHVAISCGDGTTIEARGKQYGVNNFPATNRPWTHAGLVPGLDYGPPPAPPRPTPSPGDHTGAAPAFDHAHTPGTIESIRAFHYDCPWVRRWQERMRERGWRLTPDADYGRQSETACKRFQAEKGLAVTGVLDAATWTAAWETKVT